MRTLIRSRKGSSTGVFQTAHCAYRQRRATVTLSMPARSYRAERVSAAERARKIPRRRALLPAVAPSTCAMRKSEQWGTPPEIVTQFALECARVLPNNITHLVDIGCGDGRLGNAVCALRPSLILIMVDLHTAWHGAPESVLKFDATQVTAANLGNPPPQTTAIIGNMPFTHIDRIHVNFAGMASFAASIEPYRTTRFAEAKIPSAGWLETKRVLLPDATYTAPDGASMHLTSLYMVVRTHAGAVIMHPRDSEGAPSDYVVRCGYYKTVGKLISSQTKVQRKWGLATKRKNSMCQNDFFIRYAFGNPQAHRRRFDHAQRMLCRVWSRTGKRVNINRLELFQGYYNQLHLSQTDAINAIDRLQQLVRFWRAKSGRK